MDKQNRRPQVSVIIPTRNEAAFIDRCLESVFSADPVPGGMEVLVVDGMSSDGTRGMLDAWCQRKPNLRVLDNPLGIVPSAMNIGVRAAQGGWIIRLDAHSEYPKNYFTLCLKTSQRTGADNVGGAVLTLLHGQSLQRRLVHALTTHSFGVGNSAFRTGAPDGWVDTVPFGCYRREVFDRIGLYDERLVRNQDYELNRRLLKMGGRIWFNSAIQVRYYNQSSLTGLFRQAFTTGEWNPWMWFVAPYTFAWRHAIPMVFVAALLFVALLLFILPNFAGILLGVILMPYLFFALGASLHQASRYGALFFLALPGLFFVYHLMYGLGGLWGVCLLLTRQAPVQLTRQNLDEIPESTRLSKPNQSIS